MPGPASSPNLRYHEKLESPATLPKPTGARLSEMGDANGPRDFSATQYLRVYILLLVLYGLSSFVRMCLISDASLRASRIEHDELLTSIVRC